MSINLLPKSNQDEFKKERIRRFVVVLGTAIFSIIVVNIILLSPLWILFKLQEIEQLRQLDALKQSPSFLRASDLESEIRELNANIAAFNSRQSLYFETAPAVSSLLATQPSGVSITSLSFTAPDGARNRPPMLSVSGVAENRDLLLEFAATQEENPLFSRVRSPISNLIKEEGIDYSLVVELVNE